MLSQHSFFSKTKRTSQAGSFNFVYVRNISRELNDNLQLFNASQPAIVFKAKHVRTQNPTLFLHRKLITLSANFQNSVCFQITTVTAGVMKVLFSRGKFSFWSIIHRFSKAETVCYNWLVPKGKLQQRVMREN